jgi:hypothetical protein
MKTAVAVVWIAVCLSLAGCSGPTNTCQPSCPPADGGAEASADGTGRDAAGDMVIPADVVVLDVTPADEGVDAAAQDTQDAMLPVDGTDATAEASADVHDATSPDTAIACTGCPIPGPGDVCLVPSCATGTCMLVPGPAGTPCHLTGTTVRGVCTAPGTYQSCEVCGRISSLCCTTDPPCNVGAQCVDSYCHPA